MNEAILIFSSIIVSFFVGAVGILFLGNKTTLNYLKVKMSRHKKVLVFLKTNYGFTTLTAKKDENFLNWTFDKVPHKTIIAEGDIKPYNAVESVFIDLETSETCLKINTDIMHSKSFDAKVYSNLLERAITSPSIDNMQDLKKLIVFTLGVAVIIALICIMIYFKQADILKELAKLTIGGVI